MMKESDCDIKIVKSPHKHTLNGMPTSRIPLKKLKTCNQLKLDTYLNLSPKTQLKTDNNNAISDKEKAKLPFYLEQDIQKVSKSFEVVSPMSKCFDNKININTTPLKPQLLETDYQTNNMLNANFRTLIFPKEINSKILPVTLTNNLINQTHVPSHPHKTIVNSSTPFLTPYLERFVSLLSSSIKAIKSDVSQTNKLHTSKFDDIPPPFNIALNFSKDEMDQTKNGGEDVVKESMDQRDEKDFDFEYWQTLSLPKTPELPNHFTTVYHHYPQKMCSYLGALGYNLAKEYELCYQARLQSVPQDVKSEARDLYQKFRTRNRGHHPRMVHKCPDCSFATESEIVLGDHLGRPHYVTKLSGKFPDGFDILLRCPVCKTFDTRLANTLRSHLQMEHKMAVSQIPAFENPPCPYNCSTCMYEVSTKFYWEKHKESCVVRESPFGLLSIQKNYPSYHPCRFEIEVRKQARPSRGFYGEPFWPGQEYMCANRPLFTLPLVPYDKEAALKGLVRQVFGTVPSSFPHLPKPTNPLIRDDFCSKSQDVSSHDTEESDMDEMGHKLFDDKGTDEDGEMKEGDHHTEPATVANKWLMDMKQLSADTKSRTLLPDDDEDVSDDPEGSDSDRYDMLDMNEDIFDDDETGDYRLCVICRAEKSAIQYLLDEGIVTMPKCCRSRPNFCKISRKWKCKKCKGEGPLFNGTMFKVVRCKINYFFRLINGYLDRYPLSHLTKSTKIKAHTLKKWYNTFLAVVLYQLPRMKLSPVKMIGGPGMLVEIEIFDIRRMNRYPYGGSSPVWLVGGVEVKSGETFFEVAESLSFDAFSDILAKHVVPRSTISRDKIPQHDLPFPKDTQLLDYINHSSIINPTMDKIYSKMKEFVRASCGKVKTKEHILEFIYFNNIEKMCDLERFETFLRHMLDFYENAPAKSRLGTYFFTKT